LAITRPKPAIASHGGSIAHGRAMAALLTRRRRAGNDEAQAWRRLEPMPRV
jgi:hypothetical protein